MLDPELGDHTTNSGFALKQTPSFRLCFWVFFPKLLGLSADGEMYLFPPEFYV